MPHGLSYDPFGNVWLTDVALHQVFKYNKQLDRPALVLGERFVPGKDAGHFCKPTDVQVSARRRLVYVSDGYCNGRIVVFAYDDGRFVKQFGEEQDMRVAHSLSLIEELDLVCVADRERGRALCYDAGIQNQSKLGEFRKELRPFQAPGAHSSLYAIQNLGRFKIEM